MWIEAIEPTFNDRIIINSDKVECFSVTDTLTDKDVSKYTIEAQIALSEACDDSYDLGTFNTKERAEKALDRLITSLVNGCTYYKVEDAKH